VEADIVTRRLTAPVGAGNRDDANAIARLFLRLGLTAFGGPSAHIALMEAEVVTKRGWLTRGEFLDRMALVQVLPGPNSTELAIHIGYARGGGRGAVIAGLCFILPSVVLVWLLAALSAAAGLRAITTSVLWWMTPVVVVIIADALWKFGRQAWGRPGAMVVMPLTALAAVVLPSDLLVLGAGAAAALLVQGRRRGGALGVTAFVAGALTSAGGVGAQTAAGAVAGPGLTAILLYFLRAGVSVFGSGYVLLAYLQRDLVQGRGWLSMDALLQASALAQVTPGPLFSTATAAGYIIGGSAGAAAATIGIFLPAFASVAVGEPVRRLLERSPSARIALDGVVIASVALLGRALVGFAVPLEPVQWVACGGVAVALLRYSIAPTVLLLTAGAVGAAGAVLHLFPS
jgi:chromate transporter